MPPREIKHNDESIGEHVVPGRLRLACDFGVSTDSEGTDLYPSSTLQSDLKAQSMHWRRLDGAFTGVISIIVDIIIVVVMLSPVMMMNEDKDDGDDDDTVTSNVCCAGGGAFVDI
eukprot:2619082-Rhodomonas_salina.2